MSTTTEVKAEAVAETHKVTDLIDAHGIDVLEHLDREAQIPVLRGLQRQGDILVIPEPTAKATNRVPSEGVAVVRGENGGNTHSILADGEVYCDLKAPSQTKLTVAALVVAPGATAFLAHPEHGYMAIGEGKYVINRQREQAEEIRIVAD